ncbi:MAG: hypothetical protein MUC89_23660 [Acetobacteraceae bacterium]|jgi:hypothetical protein|nr:hypothetical protein [Acetobacteraceae bacterium]
MIGPRALAAALAVLAIAAMPSPATAVADRCAAPAEFSLASGALPHVAEAVNARGALRVLIIGTGSSTQGGTSVQAASYPRRLEKDLTATFPGLSVTVQTRGGRGLTAAMLLPVLKDGLREFGPDLVIWQSGTVDAVRGLDPDGYANVIAEGAEKALAQGADVVLMDMQFSRFSRAAVNYGPYRHALEAAAAANTGVIGFPRYELMRFWAASGQIDVERAPRPEWLAQTDILHACLSRKLAELIRDGVRQASR